MLNVSSKFREALINDNRNYLCYADIELTDGTELNLENNQIWSGGLSVEDAVSNESTFDIGSAIINQSALIINNIYDEFSKYDFTGARVDLKVGLALDDGTIEKVDKGTFYVDETKYNGSIITLTCLDRMSRFDKDYSESALSYPATLLEIVRDACNVCGVLNGVASFPNSNFVVDTRPTDDSLTFRQVLLWVGQISCQWFKIKNNQLVSGWYDMEEFADMKAINGGRYTEEVDDRVSGGTFGDSTPNSISGGTFGDKDYIYLFSLASENIDMDDVVITGINVTEYSEDASVEPESYMQGSQGYVLSISDNRLITTGKGSSVADYLAGKLVGLRFRPMNISAQNDPTIEAGDLAFVTDYKGNTYVTLITNTTFTVGNYQTVICGAESAARNSASRYSQASQLFSESKKQIKNEKTQRELAIEELTNRVANASGLYTTEETQEDGSTIFYMHDKPTLEESKIVWKMTAETFTVSTDGGKTWNAGLTVDGDVIARIMSTIGINFDWGTGGTLTLGGQGNINGLLRVLDASGNEIGQWNKDGIYIDGGEINSKTTSTGISIRGGRMNLMYGETNVGYIGTNYITGYPDNNGIVFDLESNGSYMTWACREKQQDDEYTVKMLYSSKKFSVYEADTFYFGCDIDMNNYSILNASIKDFRCSESFMVPNDVDAHVYSDIDFHNWALKNVSIENVVQINGYTPADGTFNVVTSIQDSGNGKISWNYGTVTIRDGIITGWPR